MPELGRVINSYRFHTQHVLPPHIIIIDKAAEASHRHIFSRYSAAKAFTIARNSIHLQPFARAVAISHVELLAVFEIFIVARKGEIHRADGTTVFHNRTT